MKTLAVKYRPAKFADVVEQKNIISVLQNQIKNKDFKNAYLFTGSAGTGKTTIARIFAGEINAGAGVPIEIDGASNNGVENVRRIIDEAKFISLDSPYKIYIIDECHMLTVEAWNALLKLLEEPPTRTIFLFCTTDAQKIPATILSRVQRYDFGRISPDGIFNRLKEICTAEKLKTSDEVLRYLATLSAGGMRDAITLLDKCFSAKNPLELSDVYSILGTIDFTSIADFVLNLLNGKTAPALLVLNTLYCEGYNLKQFVKSLFIFILNAEKYIIFDGDIKKINVPEEALKNLNLQKSDLDFLQFLLEKTMALTMSIKYETDALPLVEAFVFEVTKK